MDFNSTTEEPQKIYIGFYFDSIAFDSIVQKAFQDSVNRIVDWIEDVINKGRYTVDNQEEQSIIISSDETSEISCCDKELYEVKRVYKIRGLQFQYIEDYGSYTFKFTKLKED